jgi:hypothetical protein
MSEISKAQILQEKTMDSMKTESQHIDNIERSFQEIKQLHIEEILDNKKRLNEKRMSVVSGGQ